MSDPATLDMGPQERQRAEQLSLQPLRPPTQVPGYEPERFLGRGAYGEVWVAVDCNSGRRVAIKFFSLRGRQDWSSLSREVEKLGLFFNDRHVVQLFKVGWDADPPYYVMEFLENGSLDEQLQGPLEPDRAVTLFREIATGLQHAHNRGVLHCDLKPANILLDGDHKPRLADFGQARLAHEQAPALGTLFYMAPEQADLRAAPDARWDVYSLGVLLYRMLTGDLPYRSAAAVTELQEARGLDQRLATYRRLLREAPRPTAHRDVPDIDRALVQIVDRCLAVQPEKRFPNVQAVLAALDARALQRARRPLLMLGALGPALLLGGMFLFAWVMIVAAVDETKTQITDHVQEGNRLMARFAAERLAERIGLRWKILQEEASSPVFQGILREVGKEPPAADATGPPTAPQRWLQEWLDERRRHYNYLHIDDSWFVVDETGRLLDVSTNRGRERSKKAIGRYYWHRDYFHGKGADLDPAPGRPAPADIVPIDRPYQSLIFRSSEDRHPFIVVFAAPIQSWRGKEAAPKPLGVLAMAVRLGNFSELWTETEPGQRADHKWVSLVQTREHALPPDLAQGRVRNAGLVLEHPALRAEQADAGEVPLVYLDEADLNALRRDGATAQYRDPFQKRGGPDANRYLAAAEPVRVKRPAVGSGTESPGMEETGWLVVVQDDYAKAVAPAVELEWKLVRRTLGALALATVLVTGLWVVVSRGLVDSPRSRLAAFLRRRSGLLARTPAGSTGTSGSRAPTPASSHTKSS